MLATKSHLKKKLFQAIELLNLDSNDFMYMNYWEDTENNIIFMSQSCINITGYSKLEFLNKEIRLANIVFYEDNSIWNKIFKKISNNDSYSTQLRIRHKNGKIVWVNIVVKRLFYDNEYWGVYTQIKDITKNKLDSEISIISPTIFFLWEKKEGWPVSFVTENIKNILGYDADDFLMNKISYIDIIHRDDYDRVVEEVKSFSTIGVNEFVHKPYRIITKSGEIRWVDDKTSIKRDLHGKIIYYQGSVTDITDKKLATEKIDFFSKIIKQASSPLITTDLNFKITWINDAFKRLTGYGKEIIGKTPNFLNSEPNSAEIQTELYEAISKGTVYKNIILNKRKDGSTFKCEIEIFPIFDIDEKITAYAGYTRDITQILKIKEDIKKFKTISDEALYGNAIVDLEGTIIYVNKYFANIHGFKTDELVGQNMSIFFNDDQIEKVTQFNKTLLHDGKFGPVEVWSRHKNASDFPMLMSCVLIYDDKNIPLYRAYTTIDITLLKKNEDALRKSEGFYKAIFNRTPLGIFHFDKYGNVADCNLEFARIVGTLKEKLIGINLFVKLKDNKLKNEIKKTLKYGTGYYEDYYHFVITKKVIYAIIYINALYDEKNKIVGGVALVEDASNRKKTEIALRENIHHIELINANIPNVIWRTEYDEGTFTNSYISEVADRLLNLPTGAINNNFKRFLSYVLPEYSLTVVEKFEEAFKNPNNFFSLDYEVKKKDGKTAWFSSKGRVIIDKNKKIIYGSTIDITKSKMIEEHKEKMLDQAQKLVELKSNFISTVSHEFRTPLSLILSSTELLEMVEDNWSREKRQNHFCKIKKNITILTSMLDEASFLESGKKLNYAIESFDIIDLGKVLINEAQKLIKKKTAIEFVSSKKKFYINSSEQLIRRIVLNLLTNSLKYTPENKKITFKIEPTENSVCFNVSDEGIGISHKNHEIIFNKFVRDDNVGTISGTGLGLAIVEQAVELLNGKITFTSKINIGTSFVVEIPLNS